MEMPKNPQFSRKMDEGDLLAIVAAILMAGRMGAVQHDRPSMQGLVVECVETAASVLTASFAMAACGKVVDALKEKRG